MVLVAASVATAGSATGWAQTDGTVSYSNNGTGLLSGSTQGVSAEWLGFTSTDLTLGGPGTSYSFTLAGGYDLTFTATLTGNDTASNSTVPTTGEALFGNTGYTGVTGDVAIWGNLNGVWNDSLALTSISLTGPGDIPVTSGWKFIEADVETTGNNENITGATNGGDWTLADTLTGANNPTLTGVGTSSFADTGNTFGAASYSAYLLSTTDPTQVTAGLYSDDGQQAVGFAIVVPPVPEPSSCAMAFAGLGLVILMQRVRRTRGNCGSGNVS